MSGDEMREQKIRLRVELEEAEEHMSALRVKAELHADVLSEIATRLRARPETDIFRHGASAHYGQAIETLKPISDHHVRALDLKSILDHADEIRKEAQRISQLRERLASLR